MTAGTLDLQDAFNELLEEERACVEIIIALYTGATELPERETLASLGTEHVRLCCTLRDEADTRGFETSAQMDPEMHDVIEVDRLDERLERFAAYLSNRRSTIERAQAVFASSLLNVPIDEIEELRSRTAEWCIERAASFAASRNLDFRIGRTGSLAAVDQAQDGGTPIPELKTDQSTSAPTASADE